MAVQTPFGSGPTLLRDLPQDTLASLRDHLVRRPPIGLHSSEDAEDLAHDVLVAGLEGPPLKYPTAWLHRVRANKCAERARKRLTWEKYFGKRVVLDEEVLAREAPPDWDREELRQLVQEAVAKLPVDEQAAVACFLADLTVHETAAVLNCHRNSARARRRRAFEHLRKKLRDLLLR